MTDRMTDAEIERALEEATSVARRSKDVATVLTAGMIARYLGQLKAERERVAELECDLKEQDAELEVTRQEIAELEAETASLRTGVAELEAAIAEKGV